MIFLNNKKHLFSWKAMSLQGKKLSGEMKAKNLETAKNQLRHQGLIPIFIRKKKNPFFAPKISPLEIALFFRQLATLLGASIPIVQCCNTLLQTQENLTLKQLIISLKTDLESGKSLTHSLGKFPNHFDDITCSLVHMGEHSGTLQQTLQRIALYQEKSLTLKKQIQQALFYPTLIFSVAIIVTVIMLTCVVPRFETFFQAMHGKLPSFTLLIISISHFLQNYFWLALLPIVTGFSLAYFQKKLPTVKYTLDRYCLQIPYLKAIQKKIILAKFARNLATTFSAGLPIIEALKIIAPITGNDVYRQAITRIRTQVVGGQQLHSAMQAQTAFSPLFIHMIKIGEESGTLDLMLQKIAELYESDIDHWVANLSHLLEPLIMIVLGVLIGGLVIGMYLPIFKLGTIF